VPGAGDNLESMIWVITYAMMVHHQERLQGWKKAHYKRGVVDKFYGSMSYSGLSDKRTLMVIYGISSLGEKPEGWFPEPAQSKWFRKAMTLVDGRLRPSSDGTIKPLTFDAFDALCDEFITDK
jgi:hypothetical protein